MTNLRETQAAFQNWLLDRPDALVPKVKDARGLGIYHTAYRARLREALGETFEKTWSWIGDELFDAAVASFVAENASVHWSLSDYGGGFPAWLCDHFSGDPEIGELASLEWALHVCFSAPDAVPLSLDSLVEIDWEMETFILTPSYAELPMKTNAASIWRALSDGVDPPVAAMLAEPVTMRIWRKALAPQFATMEMLETIALQRIAHGATFGDICAELAEKYPQNEIATEMAKNLQVWLTDRLFTNKA